MTNKQTEFGPDQSDRARLSAQPAVPGKPIGPMSHRLALADERDGWLNVPDVADRHRPLPLIVMLHGAGAAGVDMITLLRNRTDAQGIILLAPDSRGSTWDMLLGRYGPDVDFINLALQETFQRCNVDPDRLAIGGFSDGASYALSLGLVNGDLFTHILGFLPGFLSLSKRQGEPQIFMSHGTDDTVLPINRCSRRILPILQKLGYTVTYREFNGGHTVPDPVAQEALLWLMKR